MIKTEIFQHHDDRLCFAGVSSSTENGEARSWSENPGKCDRERESTNEIARFGVLKLPIPAISNPSASGKQTPDQSLRGLFTDD
jgi:hypothetical protein